MEDGERREKGGSVERQGRREREGRKHNRRDQRMNVKEGGAPRKMREGEEEKE